MLVFSLIGLLCAWNTVASSSHPLVRDSQVTFETLPPSTDLVWSPCYDKFQCAKLDLPLDPDEPSNDNRVYIPLLKYPANVTEGQTPRMMLFNPGGPGTPGTTFLPVVAPILADLFGSTWDIVAFDPRGVGFAFPSTNCSTESDSGSPQPSFSKRAAGLSAPYQDAPYFTEELDIAYTIGRQCNASIGANSSSIGHYVSTYYIVQDTIGIVDAYSKSSAAANFTDASLVNFYGLSAGTIIGQTLASLFPNRLGRVILDGVVDPYDYVSGKNLRSVFLDDEIVQQFLRLCQMAGPAKCAFAQDQGTSLFSRFEAMINRLNPVAAAENGWDNASDISTVLAMLTNEIDSLSFFPIASFPTLGSLLAAVEPVILSNFSLLNLEAAVTNANLSSPLFGQATQPSITARSEWTTAIECSDADRVYGENATTSDKSSLRNESALEGAYEYAYHHVQCVGWPITPHKRFAGPFGSSSNNSAGQNGSYRGIQFIGITLDFATPLANAVSSSKLFGGSKVIAIDSVGHTGLSAMNQCYTKAIQQYLLTGQPTQTFCPLELAPFNVSGLTTYGWLDGGQLVSNQTRVYENSQGEGRIISDLFNSTG